MAIPINNVVNGYLDISFGTWANDAFKDWFDNLFSTTPKTMKESWRSTSGFLNGKGNYFKNIWDNCIKPESFKNDWLKNIPEAAKEAGKDCTFSKKLFGCLGKRLPLLFLAMNLAFTIPNIFKAFSKGGAVEGTLETGKEGIKLATSSVGFAAGSAAASFLGAKIGTAIGTLVCPGLGSFLGGALGFVGGFVGGSIVGKYVNKFTTAILGKSFTEKLEDKQKEQQTLMAMQQQQNNPYNSNPFAFQPAFGNSSPFTMANLSSVNSPLTDISSVPTLGMSSPFSNPFYSTSLYA